MKGILTREKFVNKVEFYICKTRENIERCIKQIKEIKTCLKIDKVKKYKIVNKMKLVRLLSLISLFVMLGTFSYVTLMSVSNATSLSGRETAFLESFDLVEIRIFEGDASWKIQKELTPNEDIRKMLYYGGIVNGKSMGNIVVGEKIIFLKAKDINFIN